LRRVELSQRLSLFHQIAGFQADTTNMRRQRRRDDVPVGYIGFPLLLNNNLKRTPLNRRRLNRNGLRPESVQYGRNDQQPQGNPDNDFTSVFFHLFSRFQDFYQIQVIDFPS
jgi:hypothetical protein